MQRAWKEYLAEDLKTGKPIVLRIPVDPEKAFRDFMKHLEKGAR